MLMFLVDHHLTFWRYATSRNLEDLSVIEEFAGIMKDKRNLDALLLFTQQTQLWSLFAALIFLSSLRVSFHDVVLPGREEKEKKLSTLFTHWSTRLSDSSLLPRGCLDTVLTFFLRTNTLCINITHVYTAPS